MFLKENTASFAENKTKKKKITKKIEGNISFVLPASSRRDEGYICITFTAAVAAAFAA